MQLVLDNSVVMRWLFADGSDQDRDYAACVLDKMEQNDSEVAAPAIWPLEVANVIARAESKGWLAESKSTAFLGFLSQLGVVVDEQSTQLAWETTLQLARRFRLSSYDAAYLELALRLSAPLATLDVDLIKAATTAGIQRF